MNPITDRIKTGTAGEILVQLRLLEHGVQAAPPIKDSGNDLIAIRGNAFRAIQVKTTTRNVFTKNNLPELFHILAVVQLIGDEDRVLLDQSRIFLVPREHVDAIGTRIEELNDFAMTQVLVNQLFAEN